MRWKSKTNENREAAPRLRHRGVPAHDSTHVLSSLQRCLQGFQIPAPISTSRPAPVLAVRTDGDRPTRTGGDPWPVPARATTITSPHALGFTLLLVGHSRRFLSLPVESGDRGPRIALHGTTPSVWRARAAERILRWRRPCVSWRVHPVHRRARAPWERAQRRWRSSRPISRRPPRGGDATARRADGNAAAAQRLAAAAAAWRRQCCGSDRRNSPPCGSAIVHSNHCASTRSTHHWQ
jgi:hypothetical protein